MSKQIELKDRLLVCPWCGSRGRSVFIGEGVTQCRKEGCLKLASYPGRERV